MANPITIDSPEPLCLLCLQRTPLVDEDRCCSCGGHVIAGYLGDIEAVEEALSEERASLEVLRGLLKEARPTLVTENRFFADTDNDEGVRQTGDLLARIDAVLGDR